MKAIRNTRKLIKAAVVIAVVLGFFMPSSAVFTDNTKNDSRVIQRTMKVAPVQFQKTSSCPMGLTRNGDIFVYAGETPSIVRDFSNNLWVFLATGDIDSDIYMLKSTDFGQTWSDIWYLPIEGYQSYPVATIDPVGNLWVGFIDEGADTVYVLEGQNPNEDPLDWLWGYFTPSADATYHKQMTGVTTYSGAGGIICAYGYIVDIIFGEYDWDEQATILHQASAGGPGGDWTYTWDPTYMQTSHPAIGSSDSLIFFAFQYPDNVTGNYRVNVRWGDPEEEPDMELWKNIWGMFETSDSHNSKNPSISGSGSNVVVVYESDENGNQDIMCSYTDDNSESWTHNVVVVDDAEDEENPRVFMMEDDVYCLYTKSGNLYMVISNDGGATWGEEDPIIINDVDDSVEVVWRTAEIAYPFIVWTDHRNEDLEIFFDLGGGIPDMPYLNITDITGGFGVSAVISNTGEADATDVDWSISISGGLFGLIDKEVSDTIPLLSKNDEVIINSGIILGIGPITITIETTALGANTAEETTDGKQLFIFTLVS